MTNHDSKRRKLSHSEASSSRELSENTLVTILESSQTLHHGPQSPSMASRSLTVSLSHPKVLRHSRAQNPADDYRSQSHGRSLLQMQIEQLVADVSVNYKSFSTRVDILLRSLEIIIDTIPPQGPTTADEAGKFLYQIYGKAIRLPQDGPKASAKYTFSYEKPTKLCTIGSYKLQTNLKSAENITIDMAIMMPLGLFQSKDYKDFRYFHKRAYYLACIFSAIRKQEDLCFQIHLGYENDCLLQPIIILTPSESAKIELDLPFKWQLRLLIAVDEDLFPVKKHLPWEECFRLVSNKVVGPEARMRAMLSYSSAIRVECSRLSYEKLFEDTRKRCPGYRDACKMGTLWLQQRGFKANLRAHGVGPFEFAAMMALLLSSGGSSGRSVLSARYDSFQLFKGVLHYLSTRNLVKQPLSIGGNVDFPSQGLGQTPILYDAIRGLNVLYKMSLWSYHCLSVEARSTLEAIGNSVATGHELEGTFITRVDQPMLRFDMVMRINIPVSWSSDPPELALEDRIISFAPELHRILSEGLGDRAALINLQLPEPVLQQSSLDRNIPKADPIIIQLLLNFERSNRIIDRGPAADEKQAAIAFRRFWGEKAELRRYKDGSILESSVWSQNALEGSVCEQIIRHVVRRHLGEEAEQSLACLANGFHRLLCDHEKQLHHFISLYRPAFTAFESLEKQIRHSEELPLQVRRIATSCQYFRYTSLMISEELASQGYNAPLDIIVQFEGSSRWPKTLPAIQQTKIAFLVKIGELLNQSTPNLLTRVGLENTTRQPIYNLPFLDITSPKLPHQAFRLRIHHEQELFILERQFKSRTVSLDSRNLIAGGLVMHRQKFLDGPLHTQVVASLCLRYPLLSPSIQLLKKWCATHFLPITLIPPEVLELLTIHCFVSPFPWSQPPASIRTGFLRTLSLIAKWDWPREPMIINVSGEMKQEERDTIQIRFETWRKIDPGMNRVTFFIASTMDPSGVAWTQRAIGKVIARRLQLLARAACQVVSNSEFDTDVESIFTHSYIDYDFLIHLDTTRIRSLQNLGAKSDSQFKNLRNRSGQQGTFYASFEPLELFIRELNSIYGNSLLLFYNPLTPEVMGGLWHPSVSTKKSWKVGLGYSKMPCSARGLEIKEAGKIYIDINRLGILREIKGLGGDMVKSVELLDDGHLP